MLICTFCGEECEDFLALGRHIKNAHPRKKKAESVSPAKEVNTHCPACNFEIPYTTAWGNGDCTVCPRCGTMFDTHQVNATTGVYVTLKKHEGPPWSAIYAQNKAAFTELHRKHEEALRGKVSQV